MKKKIDVLFFIFYNNQYNDGMNTNQPWVRALGLLIGGTMAWVMLFLEILATRISFIDRHFEGCLLLICIILFCFFYFTYIKKDKYESVYEKYKYMNISRGKNVVIVLCYICSPTIAAVILALKLQGKI